MTHLSTYELDLLAAGEATSAACAHVSNCDTCRAQLVAHEAELAQIRQMPRFHQLRAATLSLEPSTPPSRSPRPWTWLAASAALVGALALTLFPFQAGPTSADSKPPVPGVRVKGVARLMAVGLDGAPRAVFAPGDEVVLIAKTVDYSHAVVLGVDAEGHVSQVWPPTPSQSGTIPQDGALSPAFRVTPGDVALHAVLSDEPVDVERAIERTRAALAECPGRALDPECAYNKLRLDPGQATVNYLLQVQ